MIGRRYVRSMNSMQSVFRKVKDVADTELLHSRTVLYQITLFSCVFFIMLNLLAKLQNYFGLFVL